MRAPLLLLLLGAALAVAACGTDGGDSGGSAARPAATASAPQQVRLGIRGIEVRPEDHESARRFFDRELPEQGVFVASFVGDPPAKAAGLKDMGPEQNSMQNSDVIELLDGQPVTIDLLEEPLEGKKVGDTVVLRVWPVRGEPYDLTTELQPVPTPDPDSGGYFPGG